MASGAEATQPAARGHAKEAGSSGGGEAEDEDEELPDEDDGEYPEFEDERDGRSTPDTHAPPQGRV